MMILATRGWIIPAVYAIHNKKKMLLSLTKEEAKRNIWHKGMRVFKEETSFPLTIKLNIHMLPYYLQINPPICPLNIWQLQVKSSIIKRPIFFMDFL